MCHGAGENLHSTAYPGQSHPPDPVRPAEAMPPASSSHVAMLNAGHDSDGTLHHAGSMPGPQEDPDVRNADGLPGDEAYYDGNAHSSSIYLSYRKGGL